jgi:hypothetical protein
MFFSLINIIWGRSSKKKKYFFKSLTRDTGSTAVEHSTRNHVVEGLNPAIWTGREKIAGKILTKFFRWISSKGLYYKTI